MYGKIKHWFELSGLQIANSKGVYFHITHEISNTIKLVPDAEA